MLLPVNDNVPLSVLVNVPAPLNTPAIDTDCPATTSNTELPVNEIARPLATVKFPVPPNSNVPLLSDTPLVGPPRLPSAVMPSVPPVTDAPAEKVLAGLLSASMPPAGTARAICPAPSWMAAAKLAAPLTYAELKVEGLALLLFVMMPLPERFASEGP